MSALRTLGLTKTYGDRRALAGVDLVVPEGSLYGLVGSNGSGKTTLIEILAGLRRASGGVVDLGVGEGEVAYCPDVAELESWLTAAEVLEAALGLIGRRRPRRDLDALLGRVGLAEVADRRVGGFSRGMTTRLNLASGLVGEPKVLLADEPAAALDPAGKAEVLALLASLAPEATVIVSSHDLSDVAAICDHVGVLADGRLGWQGPLEELLAGAGRSRWRLVVRPPASRVLDAYETANLEAATAAYTDLVEVARSVGAAKAAGHLLNAAPHALTFLTHPDAGRLLFGDKGRPELATGVLERVMREMNRRTDVGVRWSVPGVRGLLMVKLGRKYHHGRWAEPGEPEAPAHARFALVA